MTFSGPFGHPDPPGDHLSGGGRARWGRAGAPGPAAVPGSPWPAPSLQLERLQRRADEREAGVTAVYLRRRSMVQELAEAARRADAMARLEFALSRLG